MSLRETMNNSPAAATGVVVGVLVIALGVIFFTQCRGGSTGGAAKATYFDTSTGQVVLVKISSGNYGSPLADNANAYRCTILSCGECGEITEGMTLADLEAKGMYIGFISRDPGQASGDGNSPHEAGLMTEEISAAADLNWLSMTAHGAAFNQLQEGAFKCEGDGRANVCRPQ